MLHTYIRTFDVTSIVENFLTTKRSLKTCVQRPAQTYPITLPKEEMLIIQISKALAPAVSLSGMIPCISFMM